MWELTVFVREGDEALVASIGLPGVDVALLREICGAARDDPMHYETEALGSRVGLLREYGDFPVDPARFRYFIGESAG